MKKPIGILGGTFDPIHFGHLRTALEIYQQFDLQEIRLIPCQIPVLKKPTDASAEHRLAMLKLAIDQQPGLVVDDRELQRSGPSYTIDTLLSLRAELGDTPLWLILGSDTLATLDQWQRWQELIEHAHLFIEMRPDYVLPKDGTIAKFLWQHKTDDLELLHNAPAGKIYMTHLAQLAIAATTIREQLAKGLNPRYLLPDSVLNYIIQNKLYLKP